MRKVFFGTKGDTLWNLNRLRAKTKNFHHHDIDIRDRESIFKLFKEIRFDCIIHCAAQPSHDKAREIPILDFEVNYLGTMNLLEATRCFNPDAVFVHMSTNKVYGDAPNEKPLKELPTRWEYADPCDYNGIDENCRIDQSLYSLFGASKVAADIMAQEYGRYFGLRVGIFRGGCLTGPNHSGVELHGFLSYLLKIVLLDENYKIYGYKGKQVRDQIHSFDVINAIKAFIENPGQGEVYNIGGGRQNSASLLECITKIEEATDKKIKYTYEDTNRIGDHICYITNMQKFKSHYPDWDLQFSIDNIIEDLVKSYLDKSR